MNFYDILTDIKSVDPFFTCESFEHSYLLIKGDSRNTLQTLLHILAEFFHMFIFWINLINLFASGKKNFYPFFL